MTTYTFTKDGQQYSVESDRTPTKQELLDLVSKARKHNFRKKT